jgi:enediyne biosynthesis protein E4
MGFSGHSAGHIMLLAIAAGAAPLLGGDAPMSFSEVSGDLGIDHRYTFPGNGIFISPMLAGIAAGDFNRDGLDDLFILGGGSAPDQLLIASMTNDALSYTDQARAWGVDRAHIGAGVSVADYNNDGYLDLYITSHGSNSGQQAGRHILYRNTGPDSNGQFAFTDEAAAAGVNRTTAVRVDGFSSSWGDIDLDGDLDLVVTGWVAASGGNRLFQNNNDGTFTDITADALPASLEIVRGFTPRIIDVTGDTYPEILIAADYGTSALYLNDGTGSFTDATAASNTSQETNGMGATNADFNNDGMIDWYVTSIMNDSTDQDGNKFYLNQSTTDGVPVFGESSVAAGIDDGGWGWGTAAGDLDLDGDVDILETNGWSGGQWTIERAYLFLNQANGATFTEESIACGIDFDAQGRGILLWDMDHDGDLDAAFPAIDGDTGFYRNDRAQRAPASWITIRLDTNASPSIAPDGVGAKVTVTANGNTYHRWVQANSDYLSQPPIEAHFGLADASAADSVLIEWPNGATRTLTDLAVNASYTIASCDADTTGDGMITAEDVSNYINAFLARERRADLLPDRRFNFFDIVAYLNAYQTGCTPDTSRRSITQPIVQPTVQPTAQPRTPRSGKPLSPSPILDQ